MSMTLSGDGSITGLVAGGLPDASVVDADLSLVANSAPIKTALNASGDAPIFACRAFVNFNGTSTVAIRESGNVSSITDNGTGNYTVNFATAMEDANYSAVTSGSNSDNDDSFSWDVTADNLQTNSFRMASAGTSNNLIDAANLYAAIFR